MKKIKNLLVLDIETINRSDFNARPMNMYKAVIEVGIVEIINNKIYTRFNWVMQEYAKKITKNVWNIKNGYFTLGEIKSARPFSYYKPMIQKIVNNKIITCFNHKFDFEWLEARGIKFHKKAKDIMEISRTLFQNLENDYYVKFNFQKLYRYIMETDNYIEKHRALPDALDLAMVIIKLKKKGFKI